MVHYYRFTLEFTVTDISIAFECLNQYNNAVKYESWFLSTEDWLEILFSIFCSFCSSFFDLTKWQKKRRRTWTWYVLSRQRCLILNKPVIFFNTDQMSRARISKHSIHIYSTCFVLDICVLGIAQHHFNTFLFFFIDFSFPLCHRFQQLLTWHIVCLSQHIFNNNNNHLCQYIFFVSSINVLQYQNEKIIEPIELQSKRTKKKWCHDWIRQKS